MVATLIPIFHPTTFQRVRLHKVEDVGVWVESQAATEKIMANYNVTMTPRTMIIFLPWPSVTLMISSLEVPSISDSAL